MPVPGGDKTLLETHPHRAKFYLVVHQPETVLAARVNGALSGDPVTTIAFDTVTEGAWGNIEAGQTLLIGSTSGKHDRGSVRVRSATSSILTIAESSDLRDVANNDYLTVLREHRFWTKYPRVLSQTEIYEDYDVPYPGEDEAFAPISMLGPCGFAFLDGPVDLDYDFTDSYPIAGSSIAGYAATYEDGDGGSSATSTHTETYSAATGLKGSETKLTVTDDNGKTSVGWRYDFILDREGSDAPIELVNFTQSISNSRGGHEELEFELFGSDASQTGVRDGTRVWVVYESWYGSTHKEIPNYYTDRANILFEGWIIGDTIVKNKDHSYVRFSAAPITKLIDSASGFPATLELAASPTSWIQVSSCTSVKSALYILKHRTTITEIVDVHVPSTSVATAGEDWGSGTIAAQLNEPLQDETMFVAQSKEGMIWIEKTAQLMSDSERVALDSWITLETKHCRPPFDAKEITRAPNNHAFAEGIFYDASGSVPYFSEAPGVAPRYTGISGGKLTELALSSQAHLNQISGDFLGMKNARFPNVPYLITGFWPIFDPVPQKKIVLSGYTNSRGTDLSTYSFFVEGVRYTIEKGMCQTEIILTELTNGLDGRTVSTYPLEVPGTTAAPDPPAIPPSGGHYQGTIMATNPEGAFYTDDFTFDSPPTWGDMQNDQLVAGGSKNVWSLKQQLAADGIAETLYALCYCSFYSYAPMPPSENGIWTHLVNNYEIAALASVDASQGYLMMDTAFSVLNPGHAWATLRTQAYGGPLGYGYNLLVCHTHNGWQSLEWSQSLIYNNGWHGRMSRAQISIANDGTDQVLFLSYATSSDNPGTRGVKKSIDGGSTWSDVYSTTSAAYNAPLTSLYCPYSNPLYVYAAWSDTPHDFVYSTDGGDTWSSPYVTPGSYIQWLTGPPTDETIVTLLDQKKGLYQWNGAAMVQWGEDFDWWGTSDPESYGGWARCVRILERDTSGGLVKAIIGGEDRVTLGKILLMEASGRTVITENWNVVASNDWSNCIALPAMISELLSDD